MGIAKPTFSQLLMKFALFVLASAAIAAAPSTAQPQAAAALDADVRPATACEALARHDFTRLADAPTSIVSARTVPATATVGEYCEVLAVVAPQVQVQLRLPATGWNGRYLQQGCGGLCGTLKYIESCNTELAGKFAVAAQNMGHVGGGPAVWGGVAELRVDYGARSTHVASLAAKAITTIYYGARPARSYLRGCSTGGREGLMSAQNHPADFDGIIAGNPSFAGRLGSFANTWDARQLLTRDNVPVFSEDKLKLLHRAVLAQCDGLDGLKDGILTDPRQCSFDVSSIACAAGQDRPDCLSDVQVRSARNIYDGARNSRGERVYPGHLVFGSEIGWNGPFLANLANSYLPYLAFEKNPGVPYGVWDIDFDADAAKFEKSAAIYDAVPPRGRPDLDAFHARGGKLILYHSWSDEGSSPLGSLDYYAKIWGRDGFEKTRQWFRAFMVPGMLHCRGGEAPNEFDMLTPMVKWVEQGEAPNAIVATQRRADGSVVRTRPLFAYPEYARYSGKGSPDDAASWRSARPKATPQDDIDWIWKPAN
ncbi:MAG: tannase/feruloyl esterase family alpha/beta hydrolase [Sphingobium sp.]